MLALRLHGPADARLEEVAEPELRPGTVKVRVAWAGICGSDLMLFEHFPIPNEHRNAIMGEAGPRVLGHEFSGYVDAIADDVSGLVLGDLVAVQPNFADGTCPQCRAGRPNLCDNFAFIGINGWGGGFSSAVVVPADHAFVVPHHVGAEAAAMIEPLAVGWRAAKVARPAVDEGALVVGAGPIGLAVLLSLKAMGVQRVAVSEVSESRKDLARRLGADLVIDPREQDVVRAVADMTDGLGAGVSFDASGVGKATVQAAVDALAPQGRAVLVASFHGDVPLDVGPILAREKHLTGSFAYTAEEFGEVRDALVDGRLRVERLVTSRLHLRDVVDRGIEHLLGEGRTSEVKVLVTPDDSTLEEARGHADARSTATH